MAGSRTYRTKVLVLDKTKLKETDLILTMLDERGRQVRAVAKAPANPVAPGGALRAVLYCRYAARAWTVARCGFPGRAYGGAARRYARLRDDLRRKRNRRGRSCVLVRGRRGPVYLCHNAASACPGGSGLDTAHMDLLVAAYVFKLLSHVGYRPDFSACVLCGDPMLSYFSPRAGGLMCGSCASSVPGAELVSTGEVAWLRALMSMTFDALMAERIDPHTAAFLLGLSHVWAATHTDQRLRAMEFMLGR